MPTRDLIIALKSKWDDRGTTDAAKGLKQAEDATRKFSRELEQLEKQARQQGAAMTQSAAQTDRFQRELDDVGRTSIKTRKLLEDATKRLPKIEITADTSDAERQVADLSRRLQDLSGKRIGIDLDARQAAEEAEKLRRELTQLAAMNPEIFVGANVERAIRDLDKVEREARDLDRRVNVRVDVDGASAAAAAIGLIQTALTAIRGSGPMAGAAVAAAIGALPAAAALASSALTVGLGGALAGLGLAAAHGSDAAQDAIGQLREAAKQEAAKIGQPFEAVWTRIAQVAERELLKISPVIRDNLAKLAPDVSDFVDQAGASLEELTPAIDDIEEAFSAVLAQLGPRLPEIMRHLAAAITAITQAVKENPQILADFATNLAKIAEWAGNAVAALTRFVKWAQENAAAIQAMTAVINPAAGVFGHFTVEAGKAGRESLNMGQAVQKTTTDVKAIGTATDEASVKMREGWAAAYSEFAKLGGLLDSARSRVSAQEELAQAQARAAEVQRAGAERIARAERELADVQEQSAERVKAAKRRVADAHRQAAEAVEAAEERVRNAEEALTAAVEEGAQREADAQRRVEDARERVAQVAEESGRRIEDAARRLADAQADAAARQVDADRRVADAHRRTQDAVEDLTAARERAQERLEDLIAAESGAALDEEGAQLAIDRARQRLNEVNSDPKSSDLDRREADLALRQAIQRLEEVRRRNAELRQDLSEAQRAGIDGSSEVVDALGRIEDARRAESEAAAEAARTRQESARSVADAERALADAQTEASRQQADAARQLADAESELDKTRVESARAVRDAQKDVARAQADAAQVAKESARSVADAQAEAARAVRDASREIMDAEKAVRDARREAAADNRSATDSVLESWAKLRGDSKLTSEQLLAELEKQVRDQETWRANLVRLAGRVPPEMLDELAKLGPGAAGLVASAASMSDAELTKFISLYGRSGKSAGDTFAKNLAEAGPVLADIARRQGQSVADRVREAMDGGRNSVFDAARRIGVAINEGIQGDRVVTIRTEVQEFAAKISQQADGGILTYAMGGMAAFAGGGEHHVAQIARPGTMRLWAEPETGGEAYIPLAASKRSRSEDILSQVAGRFGGAFVKRAAVGRAGGGAGVASVTNVSYTVNVDAGLNDPSAVGSKVVKAIQEYERRSGPGWRK
ncbi:hypothetical protein [Nonomuraea sp. NPDC049750]|uniref:hypothetical protein n=1 Tax=Nonomuraea sp. NPDC049750 TaxID=3154738 RepID=UPI0033F2F6C9